MSYIARLAGFFGFSIFGAFLGLQAMAAAPGPVISIPPAALKNDNLPNKLPGRYLVTFKVGTTDAELESARAKIEDPNGSIRGMILIAYRSSRTPGFAVRIPTTGPAAATALDELRILPGVAYIEADQRGGFNAVQYEPTLGVDRIDQRLLSPDSRYAYNQSGRSVHVYVIDSGIRINHTEFASCLLYTSPSPRDS